MSLHDYLHQWDDSADAAYEGYSRLYLGLDDQQDTKMFTGGFPCEVK